MSVIITKSVSKLEPALRAKAYAFLEKLNEDHALPGLHIEPIQNSVDSRVRTGRVDQGYRAVLFQLTTPKTVDYVLHGIWPHDDAIAVAKKVRLTLNPISGVPEIIESGGGPIRSHRHRRRLRWSRRGLPRLRSNLCSSGTDTGSRT